MRARLLFAYSSLSLVLVCAGGCDSPGGTTDAKSLLQRSGQQGPQARRSDAGKSRPKRGGNKKGPKGGKKAKRSVGIGQVGSGLNDSGSRAFGSLMGKGQTRGAAAGNITQSGSSRSAGKLALRGTAPAAAASAMPSAPRR